MPLCCVQVFETGPNQPADGVGLSVEPPRASELSKRINALLSSLRSSRSTYASCYVVKQGRLLRVNVGRHACRLMARASSWVVTARDWKSAGIQIHTCTPGTQATCLQVAEIMSAQREAARSANNTRKQCGGPVQGHRQSSTCCHGLWRIGSQGPHPMQTGQTPCTRLPWPSRRPWPRKSTSSGAPADVSWSCHPGSPSELMA